MRRLAPPAQLLLVATALTNLRRGAHGVGTIVGEDVTNAITHDATDDEWEDACGSAATDEESDRGSYEGEACEEAEDMDTDAE